MSSSSSLMKMKMKMLMLMMRMMTVLLIAAFIQDGAFSSIGGMPVSAQNLALSQHEAQRMVELSLFDAQDTAMHRTRKLDSLEEDRGMPQEPLSSRQNNNNRQRMYTITIYTGDRCAYFTPPTNERETDV